MCAAIALWRKRWGQSYLSSAFLTIQQVRLQALFACVVVVLPFGPQLFYRAYDLTAQPSDAPACQQEADARGINTIIVSSARL